MSQNLEEKIQDEIRRRALEVEERKLQRDGEDANKAALSEVTTLSSEEIEIIAKEVRSEFAQKEELGKKLKMRVVIFAVVFVGITGLAGMMQYNKMVGFDEQVKTQWGQVENVYQRRLDLIPNLVSTVQAYAKHEQELVKMITDARSKAGSVSVPKDMLNDQAAFQKFQEAQGELSYVLRRMMVVVEQNPSIKADQNFLALQAQLEGTENRISVERKRFNESVSQYNAYIKRFPQTMFAGVFGFKQKAYFKAEEGAQNAPAVKFN
jgi:LemA protein